MGAAPSQRTASSGCPAAGSLRLPYTQRWKCMSQAAQPL